MDTCFKGGIGMKRRLAAIAIAAFTVCMLLALCGCTEPYNPNASMKEPTVEADALQEPGTLRVGVNAESFPLSGQANGRMSGLEIDIAAAIAQEMGLKVEYVDVETSGADALSDGTVDILMGVESSNTPESCWTSDAYAPSCIAVFSLDEGASVPKKDKDPIIAAQTSSLSAWLITRQFGNNALYAEDELRAVFQDLQDGAVAYAAADAVVGSYVLTSMGIDGHIVALLQEVDGYCIGVPQKNTALQLAVTQALSTIGGNGVLKVINQKWTNGFVDVSKVKLTASAKAEAKKSSSEGGSSVSFVGAETADQG